MKVTIDSREQNRIQSATEYYKEQGLEVTVEELEIGDYIFSDGNNEVAFEFKLTSDFVSSIQDGRVFNQSINMAENYDYAFVIIHGDLATRSKCIAMSRNYREVNLFQYIGAVSFSAVLHFLIVIVKVLCRIFHISSKSLFYQIGTELMAVRSLLCIGTCPLIHAFAGFR